MAKSSSVAVVRVSAFGDFQAVRTNAKGAETVRDALSVMASGNRAERTASVLHDATRMYANGQFRPLAGLVFRAIPALKSGADFIGLDTVSGVSTVKGNTRAAWEACADALDKMNAEKPLKGEKAIAHAALRGAVDHFNLAALARSQAAAVQAQADVITAASTDADVLALANMGTDASTDAQADTEAVALVTEGFADSVQDAREQLDALA